MVTWLIAIRLVDVMNKALICFTLICLVVAPFVIRVTTTLIWITAAFIRVFLFIFQNAFFIIFWNALFLLPVVIGMWWTSLFLLDFAIRVCLVSERVFISSNYVWRLSRLDVLVWHHFTGMCNIRVSWGLRYLIHVSIQRELVVRHDITRTCLIWVWWPLSSNSVFVIWSDLIWACLVWVWGFLASNVIFVIWCNLIRACMVRVSRLRSLFLVLRCYLTRICLIWIWRMLTF